MRLYLSLILTTFFAQMLWSQDFDFRPFHNAEIHHIDIATNPGGIMNEIPKRGPEMPQSVFLYPDWKTGSILFENNTLVRNLSIKYDLFNHQIEILLPDGIKVAKNNRFNSFYLKGVGDDSIAFFNYNYFSDEPENNFYKHGIFEVVVTKGESSLLKLHHLKVSDPNYVLALDMGRLDFTIAIVYDYYLKDGNELIELPKNRKQLVKILGERFEGMEEFNKQNKIKPKDEKSLIHIFLHLVPKKL